MIQPDYRDARPPYMQVKDGIRKMIITHAVKEGEILPSVRELSSRLAVNPHAIAMAYQELEKEGYISSDGGRFTVSKMPSDKGQLFQSFDKAVTELVRMSVEKEELVQRVMKLAEGEKH